jgi:hypothetical protein
VTGLDGFEVVLAAVHALGFAGLVSVITYVAEPFGIARRWDPTLGLAPVFFGAGLGAFFVFLAIAARRAPRTKLSWWARALCAACGVMAGLALPALIK